MDREMATFLLSNVRYPGGEAMNTRSIVLCYLFVSYLSPFAACSGGGANVATLSRDVGATATGTAGTGPEATTSSLSCHGTDVGLDLMVDSFESVDRAGPMRPLTDDVGCRR
jgi:hypothetical protein